MMTQWSTFATRPVGQHDPTGLAVFGCSFPLSRSVGITDAANGDHMQHFSA